jgi:thiol-disulfide isomerase/thioredoxin
MRVGGFSTVGFGRAIFLAILVAMPLAGWVVLRQGAGFDTPAGSIDSSIQMIRSLADKNELIAPGQTISFPQAVDWINERPGGVRLGPNLTVLDFTTLWCPNCVESNPVLVDLARQLGEEQVSWVSFTTSGKHDFARLAAESGIKWPVGLGITPSDLAHFGALNSAMPLPGYEVRPLLVLVDARGKVLWTDGFARWLNQPPHETVKQLGRAIQQALGGKIPAQSPVVEKSREIARLSRLIRSPELGETVKLPKAQGWLNPPVPSEHGPQGLTVLDVAALWCPYCESTAPRLVSVASRLRNRPVRFITVVSDPLTGELEEWVRKAGIKWPVGYGLGMEGLARLGALHPTSSFINQEARPLIMVLDASGKLVWTDGYARHAHEDPSILEAKLEGAILHALDLKGLGIPTE